MAQEVRQTEPGLRERKKQRTRATLIDAAVELCNRQGFEQTTVDQIAAVAEVSPRTFSRYFATKDAVVLAFIDEVVEMVAVELAEQPPEVSDIEALYRAHVQAFTKTKTAPPSRLTADRLLASARIITSSAALMHAASQFRMDAVNAALAKRMGVSGDDRRLQLTAAVWGSIIMTSLAQLGPAVDWATMTVDGIVARIESTYAEFLEVTAGLHQPVGQLV
ncbi:TetR family transcriptional regulator [Mycolicibacterium wolinskyi]|uniref:TetR family transcriptional regulator n=1 Tax=Mycolicibacterium wolinskyi TaxID=59750 RepID=A0A1X2F9V5_9MYCO|nr:MULTISPECIES: TetR family transcriptional regulator [Mycolicibacterium]MCV7290483.1 TetR family transcriptional regulator [Mycolicibacterium wolinskyi]MCV7297043.1 TetR family transcriptional regulator [Mycolicibacterium goodii]ORX15195.1 TetR family transcriptional regulator [Mycolicibacterium wolinskyi]